ncbi:MAG: Nif11-like leader peptide family natural product precursor [Xenococcus sp. (in: cyanobacteria)]
MILESVIRFYKSLIKDENFRSQLKNASNPEEYRKIMQEAGYDFTQEELETATAQILDKDGLSELSEEDLELVFGGNGYPPIIGPELPGPVPLYGVVPPLD